MAPADVEDLRLLGVEPLAARHFVADRDDFRMHADIVAFLRVGVHPTPSSLHASSYPVPRLVVIIALVRLVTPPPKSSLLL